MEAKRNGVAWGPGVIKHTTARITDCRPPPTTTMPGARGPPPPPLARSGTRRPPARPAVALTSTPASSLRMAMELGGALCRTPARAGVGSDENARPGGASARAPAEPGAAYRPPLRAIQIQPTPNGLEFRAAGKTPARVGAVTTPLRPTNIPAPGKPKPVLRSGFSTTWATGAQLQRSKVPGSILLREENQSMQQRDSHAPAKEGNSSEHTLSLQLELDITKTILLEEVKARVEAETKQVCLIKQIEELKKKKRDQETLMLKTELEQERQAMGEAAEAITSLINQLDACNEKEMEDEGIKGSKTKRAARQLLLSFLKTASEQGGTTDHEGNWREESKDDIGTSGAVPGGLRISEGCP